MSCTLSCSTDSGARNPCTVATFVAVAAGAGAGTGGGAAGGAAAVDSGRGTVESVVAGALSGRPQATPRTPTAVQRIVPLIGDLPPLQWPLFAAATRRGTPPRGGLLGGAQ